MLDVYDVCSLELTLDYSEGRHNFRHIQLRSLNYSSEKSSLTPMSVSKDSTPSFSGQAVSVRVRLTRSVRYVHRRKWIGMGVLRVRRVTGCCGSPHSFIGPIGENLGGSRQGGPVKLVCMGEA